MLLKFFKFFNKERDDKRTIQNSGACVRDFHYNENTDFFVVLTEDIELCYIKGCHAYLFKCKWFNIDKKKKKIHQHCNITSINIAGEWYKNDPFTLAPQAQQVFQVDDLKNGSNWKVVTKVFHRHLWDKVENGEKDDNQRQDKHMVVQEDNSSTIQFSSVQSDLETQSFVHDDIEPIMIDDTLLQNEKKSSFSGRL